MDWNRRYRDPNECRAVIGTGCPYDKRGDRNPFETVETGQEGNDNDNPNIEGNENK